MGRWPDLVVLSPFAWVVQEHLDLHLHHLLSQWPVSGSSLWPDLRSSVPALIQTWNPRINVITLELGMDRIIRFFFFFFCNKKMNLRMVEILSLVGGLTGAMKSSGEAIVKSLNRRTVSYRIRGFEGGAINGVVL